uniref:Uncharacterized protein n=1 Tax=Moniliophthora roreri TaxID=221103 RepID=A0A0W0FHX6_MONRR
MLVTEQYEGYNDDYYIFSMDCWATTQQVLCAAESFHDHLTNTRPGLTFPQLLFTFNSSLGPPRQNVGQVIDHNADKLSNVTLEMSKHLESVEKKTSAQGDAINLIGCKLQTVSDDIKQLSGMVLSSTHQISLMQQQAAINQQQASLNIYLMDIRWERKNA